MCLYKFVCACIDLNHICTKCVQAEFLDLAFLGRLEFLGISEFLGVGRLGRSFFFIINFVS